MVRVSTVQKQRNIRKINGIHLDREEVLKVLKSFLNMDQSITALMSESVLEVILGGQLRDKGVGVYNGLTKA